MPEAAEIPTKGIDTPSTMSAMAQEIAKVHAEQPAWNAADDMAKAFEEMEKAKAGPVPAEPRAPGEPEPEKAVAEPAVKTIIPDDVLNPKAREEATPEVDKELEEQVKGMSEKASARFKKIHARATTAETRIKELEAELAKKSETPLEHEEFTRLKTERDELDAIVKKTKLSEHPKFKAEFDSQIALHAEQAKLLLGEKHPKLLKRFLDGDDSALDDLQEELGTVKMNRLAGIANAIQETKLRREKELENWQANYSALEKHEAQSQRQRQQEAQHEFEREWKDAVADAQRTLKAYIPSQAKEWNSGIEERLAAARAFATKPHSIGELHRMAIAAHSVPRYEEIIQMQHEALMDADKQIAKLRGVQPKIGGSLEPSNQGQNSPELSFAEAATRRLVEMGELKA